jgi:hypothetical protein
MKLNLDQNILNYDGKPVELPPQPDNPKPLLTLREVVEKAISLTKEGEILTAEKKLYVFQLGIKVLSKKRKEYDLTSDQLAFLKERVNTFYGPLVYGRFLEFIGDLNVEEFMEKELKTPVETDHPTPPKKAGRK